MTVPVYKLKWTWRSDVREISGLTVGILAPDEQPGPQYIVTIKSTKDGVSEVAGCDRFSRGVLARMQAIAKYTADILEIGEVAFSQVVPRPG